MGYNILSLSADKKIIGQTYPQIKKFAKSDDLQQKLNQIDNSVFLPDSNNHLDYFILNNSAKVTDIISTNIINGCYGILISNKFKNILDENYLICSHAYYPTTIMHKEKFYENYFFLHLQPYFNQNRIVEFADIPLSSFFIGDIIGCKINDINFKSVNEIQETRQKIYIKDSNRIFSNYYTFGKKISNLDLFVIHYCDFNIYISEKLTARLTSEQITGLQIYESNKIRIQ